ncbi:MAG: CsgG/HfaB family protein [Pseudomonadota bacterium]
MLRALLISIALLSSAAMAATTEVTREAEGYGATQKEALTNALADAVSQVRGAAAGLDRTVKETLQTVAGDGAVIVTKTSEPVQDVYAVSRGYVRSYQVLDSRQTDKGYYVRIRAVVPEFQSAISDDGKKRVAVLPFRVTLDGYTLADHGDAVAFSQRLADKLVSRLANEKDVVVINRDFFAELGLEKAVLGTDAAPEELSKLGASVGADFLLVGRVQEARTEVQEGAYGGKATKTDEIRLSWRMVEAATGKLLGAGDVEFDNVRKPKNAYSWKKRDDFEKGALFTLLAGKVADAALARPEAPAPAPVPKDETPVELTPGSSDKPMKW